MLLSYSKNGRVTRLKLGVENSGRRLIKFGSGSILTIHSFSWVDCVYSNLSKVRCDHCLGSIRGCVACGFTLELTDTLFTYKPRISAERINGKTDFVIH